MLITTWAVEIITFNIVTVTMPVYLHLLALSHIYIYMTFVLEFSDVTYHDMTLCRMLKSNWYNWWCKNARLNRMYKRFLGQIFMSNTVWWGEGMPYFWEVYILTTYQYHIYTCTLHYISSTLLIFSFFLFIIVELWLQLSKTLFDMYLSR